MTVLVLDGSDRRTAFTTQVLREISKGFAIVPRLLALEVGNAPSVSERKG